MSELLKTPIWNIGGPSYSIDRIQNSCPFSPRLPIHNKPCHLVGRYNGFLYQVDNKLNVLALRSFALEEQCTLLPWLYVYCNFDYQRQHTLLQSMLQLLRMLKYQAYLKKLKWSRVRYKTSKILPSIWSPAEWIPFFVERGDS